MHVHQSVCIWNRDISARKWTTYSNVPLYPIKCEEISTCSVHIYYTKITLLHAASYQEVQLTEYADTCRFGYQHPANGIQQQLFTVRAMKVYTFRCWTCTGLLQTWHQQKFCWCHWCLNITRINTERSHLHTQVTVHQLLNALDVNLTKPNAIHVSTMEVICAETEWCDFKMTSYYGKMLTTPYSIYINQQVTHVSFIVRDRKHDANRNTFIHVLTLNAVCVLHLKFTGLTTMKCHTWKYKLYALQNHSSKVKDSFLAMVTWNHFERNSWVAKFRPNF
jgi:hypothetical protein